MKTVWTMMVAVCLAMGVTLPVWADGTIDIAEPGDNAEAGWTVKSDGTGWVVTIVKSGAYVVEGQTTVNRLVVAQDVTATITLSNVSIVSTTASPLALDSSICAVTLRLSGNNTLISAVPNTNGKDRLCAGIQVEGNATLTIDNLAGSSSTATGSLTATGSRGAAGIGSGTVDRYGTSIDTLTTGNIIIAGGNIAANGGAKAAGIGGGYGATGGSILISGGNITAHSGATDGGAAIGAGEAGEVPPITISGGNIFAQTANPYAAGIGSAADGADKPNNIQISGGSIIALGGYMAAGIGSNYNAPAGNILISGGTLYAAASQASDDNLSYGSGIGPGSSAPPDTTDSFIHILGNNNPIDNNILISGGSIIATTIGITADGNTATPTTIRGQSTLILTHRINNNALFNEATILNNNINDKVNIHLLYNDTLPDITLHTPLHIPDSATLNIPNEITWNANNHPVTLGQHASIIGNIHNTHITRHIIDTLWNTLVFDTLRITDTLYTHHDTTLYDTLRITIHDTLRFTLIDTTLVPDTIRLIEIREQHDTLYIDHTIRDTIIIVVEPGTGLTFTIADNDPRITSYQGNAIIQGLTPNQPFTIYTAQGQRYTSDTAPPSGTFTLIHLPPGIYILHHNQQYTKFVHQ